MRTYDLWLAVIALLPGAALLTGAASVRLGRVQSEIETRSVRADALGPAALRQLVRRAARLRNALVAGLACVAALAMAVGLGVSHAAFGWPASLGMAAGSTIVGAVCLMVAAIEMMRDTRAAWCTVAELQGGVEASAGNVQIIFEFSGGPMDGKTAVGAAGEQGEADRYYALTHHGRVGQQFHVASSYAVDTLTREGLDEKATRRFQRHVYQVTDRLEGEGEVLVRAEYVREPKHGGRGAAS